MSDCTAACLATRRVVDRLDYTDLIVGRLRAKVRLLCGAGHSSWVTIDLGEAVERPIVRYAQEPDLEPVDVPIGRCRHCEHPMDGARRGQVFCSPKCGMQARKQSTARLHHKMTPERVLLFQRLWNAGSPPAEIGLALSMKARSVNVYAAVLRRRGIALVMRPHGGARVPAVRLR
jgi:hypothetical protein